MDPTSILVVDDEPGIALLCKRILMRAGYLVTPLTDPRAATQWLKQNKADLLLVDIRMPEVDGFEVIAAAKQLQPDLAVLVMTGFGTVETAIRALRQGVDGLLLKPFEKSTELVEAVKQALADSRQKHDAARVNALRPLIVNAILGHVRCEHAGYYQYSPDEQRFVFLRGQGTPLADFIIGVDASGLPLTLNATGPGDPNAQG